jgi:hypothetical protein
LDKSNASAAGLKPDDVLASIGGAPIATRRDLAEIAGLLTSGDQIEIGVNRGTTTQNMLLQFGRTKQPTGEPTEISDGGMIQMPPPAEKRPMSHWHASDDSEIVELQKLVVQQREVIMQLQQRIQLLEANRSRDSQPSHQRF